MYSWMDNKSKRYKMTQYGLEEYSMQGKNKVFNKNNR